MGIDYTSGVFFGAFAKEGTVAHSRIKSILDELEDGEASVPGVQHARVGRHGNSWSGNFRYAIRVGPSESFSSRGGGHFGPFGTATGSEPEVRRAMLAFGLNPNDFEGIGWYVFQDVW